MSDIDIKTLDKYSYSKISTYKQCKFKFKLKYLDKNFLFNANIATEFGSLIHETEEFIAQAIRDNKPIDYISLKNRFIIKSRKLALKYPAEFFSNDKSGRTYREKTYLYLDSAIYRLEKFLLSNPKLKIIGIEQKFEYDYDNIHSFNGSIDRAFIDTETNEILIQDIKSWPAPTNNSELKAPLQFAIYAMAAQGLWNVPLDQIKCEYDLPLCDEVQPALSQSDEIVELGHKTLKRLFDGINSNDFKPTVSALCHWCEYNPLTNPDIINTKPEAICPYFSTWRRSGDSIRDTIVSWHDLESVEVDRQFCISQLKQQSLVNTEK